MTPPAPLSNLKDDDLMGVIVEPDIYGLDASYSDIKAAADTAGIGGDVVKELSFKSAFGRACRQLKENRAIDRLESVGDQLVFQFTHKELDDDTLDYSYEAKVYLDPATGSVSCPDKPELAPKAKSLLDHALERRATQDVTNLVKALLKEHADLYPTSRKGGSYFVPIQHVDYARKLERFIDEVGSYKDKLRIFPVPKGTSEGNRNVRDAISAVLYNSIEELDETVEEWGDTTRDSTIVKTRKKFDEIRHKVESVSHYLMGEAEAALAKLAESKTKLRAKMEAVLDAGDKDEPEATPEEVTNEGKSPWLVG